MASSSIGSLALAACIASALTSACSGGEPASPTAPVVAAIGDDDGDASTSSPSGSSRDAAGNPAMGEASIGQCGASPASGSLPADVAAVLRAKCQPCHSDPPKNGAPFPLLTYAEIHAPFAGTIPTYQEMYMLIQPDGMPHMPFGNAPQLTSAEFTTLSSWLVSCAPPGN